MPHEPVNLSPYRAGVCWHGVKAAQRGPVSPQRYCGKGADLYEVHSHRLDPMNPRKYVTVQMWLCYSHVVNLEKRGYKVTKVSQEKPCNSPQAGAQ